jgi:hypothetical protein
MNLAIKNKVSPEAGFGELEILFIIALVGFILGLACFPQAPLWEMPPLIRIPWIISMALLFITAPAWLAGWLGKIVFPKWEAPAIRKAKYSGAFAGFCTLVLGAVVIPKHHPGGYIGGDDSCINHLRLIDSAKQQWALQHGAKSTDTPAASDLQPYLAGFEVIGDKSTVDSEAERGQDKFMPRQRRIE